MLKDSTIANNTGGGIYCDDGGVYKDKGGGVYLDNSIITNNTGGMGGGIYSASPLNINNYKITKNFAETGGGGIYSVGTLNIENSIISYNTVRYHPPNYDGLRGSGGGIYCEGAIIKNSTITKNSACYGGGIYSRNLLIIDKLSHITFNKPDNINIEYLEQGRPADLLEKIRFYQPHIFFIHFFFIVLFIVNRILVFLKGAKYGSTQHCSMYNNQKNNISISH
jgi:predicted outer membrane repeat protein